MVNAFAQSAVILLTAVVSTDKAATIPLDHVWALDMPGTKAFPQVLQATAGRDELKTRQTGLELLKQTLSSRKPPKEAMGGFAINATSLPRALNSATLGIRRNKPQGNNQLDTSMDAYLVFFSYGSAYRVEIEQVSRTDREFNIQYRFVPTSSVEMSVQFALIPVGKLAAGEYRVATGRLPLEQKFLAAGFKEVSDEQASRIVSRPFSFDVYEPPVRGPEPGKDAVRIPLERIWAWRMPGTKPMNASMKKGKYISDEGEMLEGIRTHLRTMPSEKGGSKRPEAGFVVAGSGMEAMKKAHAILTTNQQRQHVFDEGQELSLVFFSYSSSRFVHLSKTTIENNKIVVSYKFVPHQTRNLTKHFALIPLSNLKEGEYEVTFQRLPLEAKYLKAGWPSLPAKSDKVVCNAFNFTVREDPKR